MAINEFTYVDRVVRLAAQGGVTLDPANVWSSRNVALQMLADEVAADPARRAYAQRQVSGLAFAGGAADLGDDSDLLYPHIRNVTHDDGRGTVTKVTLLPYGSSRSALTYERNPFVYWGVIVGENIYVMQGDGTNAAPDGTLSFEANVVQQFSPSGSQIGIHAQLEDDLVLMGFKLAAGQG